MESQNRNIGKTQIMIMGIKDTLKEGGKAGVVGCTDPQSILNRLKKLGINAKSKPMIASQPIRRTYDEFGIIKIIGGEKKQTGFIFYCV